MKKLFVLNLMLFIFLIACKKDEDTQVTINTKLSATEQFNLFSTAVTGTTSYSKNFDIDLSNADTQAYINQIESIDITAITYKLSDFSGDVTGTISGSIMYNDMLLTTFEDLVVSEATEEGTVFEVITPETFSAIEESLDTSGNATITIDFTSDNPNDMMNFSITLGINVSIVANTI
ncbi:MAG: hypothetical protein CR968_00760 [Flavobacteriia bacterium]|nr:MAG: hypothetical protein CR968_00760 [Flavobacteriia bacterium]